jgi:hypothetical protein
VGTSVAAMKEMMVHGTSSMLTDISYDIFKDNQAPDSDCRAGLVFRPPTLT